MPTITEIRNPKLTYCKITDSHCLCPKCKMCLQCRLCKKYHELNPLTLYQLYQLYQPVLNCKDPRHKALYAPHKK